MAVTETGHRASREVDDLYRRTLAVLDREAGLGHGPAATGRHA